MKIHDIKIAETIGKATKEFVLLENTGPGEWYSIKVIFNGRIVDEFFFPTKQRAYERLEAAGYKHE